MMFRNGVSRLASLNRRNQRRATNAHRAPELIPIVCGSTTSILSICLAIALPYTCCGSLRDSIKTYTFTDPVKSLLVKSRRVRWALAFANNWGQPDNKRSASTKRTVLNHKRKSSLLPRQRRLHTCQRNKLPHHLNRISPQRNRDLKEFHKVQPPNPALVFRDKCLRSAEFFSDILLQQAVLFAQVAKQFGKDLVAGIM